MSRRCAVYTRKSTEDGLEQDFNSLQAQREACEAYILSQKSEGWELLPDAYDDGGYSGGTLQRPALQRLLDDVSADKIDIIVVYKVDRLTRSLMDFSRIVQTLDSKGASFVSITQSFNTTSSMGRLTLNVLLSFAQFEREVTAERIRDKIAASKKKGMWMGGVVPLGYDVQDRQLVIKEEDAKIIRWLYETYLDLKCVRLLKAGADKLGYCNRGRLWKDGKVRQGQPFSRGQLYTMLRNPIYIGKIHHQGQLYEGQHKGIIARSLWDRVQAVRAQNYGKRKAAKNKPTISWLARILRDGNGAPMVAEKTTKGGRQYRYYVSASRKLHPQDQGWRLPAKSIETIVIEKVKDVLLGSAHTLGGINGPSLTAGIASHLTGSTQKMLEDIEGYSPEDLGALLRPIITEVQINLTELTVSMDLTALQRALNIAVPDGAPHSIHQVTLPVQIKRRGVEMRLIIPGQKPEPKPGVHSTLARLVAKAHVWFEALKSGKAPTISAIAKEEEMDIGDVSRILPLAFLAPDIVTAIVKGDYPDEVGIRQLKRLSNLPHDWDDQRALLGFI